MDAYRIAADGDDGEIFPDAETATITTNFQDLGYGFHAIRFDQRLGFWRFANVDIPRNQPIEAAWLELTGHSSSETGVNKIFFEGSAEDDSGALDFTANPQGSGQSAGEVAFLDWQSRPRTAARVLWHESPKTTPDPGVVYTTPDLRPIIEEIVSRPGWSAGNAIQIFSGNSQTDEEGVFLTSLDWNYEPVGESSARLVVLWGCSGADSDGDGYDDCAEVRLGTNPQAACPATPNADDEVIDAWPPDVNDDQIDDIQDITELTPPYFNAASPNPNYSTRKDFNGDRVIDIEDIVQLTPPVFGTICTP
jgi:hypothetical protein